MGPCQDWPTGKHTAILRSLVVQLVWSPIKELLFCKEFGMYSLRTLLYPVKAKYKKSSKQWNRML